MIVKPVNDDQFSLELLNNSLKRIELLKKSMFEECFEKEMVNEIRVNLKKRHLVILLG